ncbi:hypothetical protein TUMSATVNIG1_39130 [Vibrio nigripulchritudo]|uniref:hypothetical protein n=1 Tax=Vibrio nigripulchritudo TaxID=28173 RepID=UPI00190E209F|nr:hypothetical protein [Vibrio nigripulchritudo]BCL71946.1 hypothetical protein VNTUMSATTG_38830 [Vibrio nigripulchritudo]BDU33304.1 hypothetical protein TUMSATVNIG1_39130 [Vibrio nigripulchritudo]
METLFRLVLKRPAVSQSEDAPSIELSQATAFQAELGQAEGQNSPRPALKAAAQKFVQSPNFVQTPKTHDVYRPWRALSASLDSLEPNKAVTNAEVSAAINAAFGSAPNQVVGQPQYTKAVEQLKDSVLAIKYLPPQHSKPIEEMSRILRDLELIAKTNDDNNFPETGAALRRYRKRSLKMPTESQLKSSLSTVEAQREREKLRQEALERRRKQAEGRLSLHGRLNSAIKELTALEGNALVQTPQDNKKGFLVPSELRPSAAFERQSSVINEFTKGIVGRSKIIDANLKEAKIGQFTIDVGSESKSLSSLLEQARHFKAGIQAFNPVDLTRIGFLATKEAGADLTDSTRKILTARKLDITRRPIDEIIQVLEEEVESLAHELDGLLGKPMKKSFKRMGRALVMTKTPISTAWNNIAIGTLSPSLAPLLIDNRVPRSHGSIAPAGIADLLVVKQQLKGYEGTDVAHIENVLKGEKKEREHIRRRETEELLFQETEITTTEERSLESTSRFEMSRETSETIQQDSSLKAGLSVSGKYGPVVEFSASAEGSISRSKQEATKTAANFSQDVTQRSANKITERVLERSSLRVTNEVTERSAHGIDNTGGDGHISGVYQWVNKVYQAQMYNYGIRTMYDFMVPEPGAFLIETLSDAHASALQIEKPMEFPLKPSQITEHNYHTWVQEYGATDVSPPPEIYITKSLDFKAGGGDDDTHYNHSGVIQIDEGYKAIHGVVGQVATIWEDNFVVDVVIGNRSHRFEDGDWVWSTSLSNERESIPFALQTWKVSYLAAIVEVKCQRTDRALMKWKLDTHAKLTNAYKARLSEYEEKLAAAELQAGVAIEGKNPALNLEIMKDELKKHCISILTEQHFDLFNAIDTGAEGFPQIDLFENEAEGPYVRFFEQAFEWEHVTWVTYPYFWGRKPLWDERIAYEDTDPLFNQFLKAGYCRVSVPIRLGFEGAVDHFISFGELWDGGPLPAISSDLYLPIADEIAERLDRPGEEEPQGDPWDVRIPTTLVHLRADDKLPKWKQNEDGEWVEDLDGA